MEEQAAARLIYKIADAHKGRCASHVHVADKIDKSILNKKCRMSDERAGARDCSWSLMADTTAR